MENKRETGVEISIVLPCLNEEKTLGTCIRKAQGFLARHNISGEVVVADNGSTDRSIEIAQSLGARVVHIPEKGYGSALRGGFAAAQGKYILMADSDDSYDLEHLEPFLEKLREGYDLVMGNRFQGGIAPGAMPWHHRYIGNPVLSFIGKLFFRTPANDFHCGIRAFTKEAIERMNLQTTGMELASEIVIKASILGMNVCEVPTRLFPDGRGRPPHLRSFRDGWRHLRFLLLYSPAWLFLYPGLFLLTAGGLLSLLLFFGPVDIGFRYIDFHTFIAAGSLSYLGLNMVSFAAITRVYAYRSGLLPNQPRLFSLFRFLNLEKGLLAGGLLTLFGLILLIRALLLSNNFAQIGYDNSVRLVFGGALALVSGVQVILTSFVLSMLGMKTSGKEML
ncbi:MAG: glycosyltransferase family 2 protein [Anaerolineales bacterium]|nr:glycosyltransferase family 2 protein [Anaerolineales bacterium]MCX7755009.1 glycosyltransferase family 2 protein [Anaerolineales bacterium]MDW8278794.1 glycosyltransferase family 2 protein [Anaerolineales bacterium]